MLRNDSGRLRPGRPRSPLAIAAALSLIAALGVSSPALSEKRLDIRKLEADYVAALEMLSLGQRDEAIDALMDLELDALGATPSTGRIDRVWRHKLGVVRKALELTTPEVLVPVIMLHHDAYQRYRDARRPVLARHARDMATDLATYKAQTTKKDADKEFAGWIMTSFGASVLTMRTSGSSASILRDALDISPNNPVALLGLSWAHEAHGEYDEAAKLLERLVKADPTHHHARLRLAICQHRLGYLEAESRANFEAVIEQASERWVRSVAHQELARILVDEENPEGAERLLRAAYAEDPTDQEIVIQLASLIERQGRRAEAADLIGGIVPAAGDTPSARFLYDGRPDLEIDAVRETMQAMMNERLDVLATGLRWWGVGTAEADTATEGEGG